MDLRSCPLVVRYLLSKDQVPGYCAAGLAVSSIELLSGRQLRLSAKLCDSVMAVGTAILKFGQFISLRQHKATLRGWFTDAVRMNSLAGPWYPTGEPQGEVLKRTMLANRGRDGELAELATIERHYVGF